MNRLGISARGTQTQAPAGPGQSPGPDPTRGWRARAWTRAFAAGLPVPAIAAIASIAGTGIIVFTSQFNSTMQRQIPERSLSRVAAYTWFGATIAYPLGLAIAGPVVAVLAVRTTLLAVGLLMILAILPLLSVRDIRQITDAAPALARPQLSAQGD